MKVITYKELKKLNMRDKEKRLIELWNKILEESKKTSNYNPSLTYGLYQIKCELNTFHKNEKGEDIPDYLILDGFINSLKTIVKDYYLKEIVPFLFEYEFLK